MTTPVWHLENDTLVLAWNDGRAGVRLTGRLAGSRFEGRATLVDDVGIGRRQTRARAAGRIVECPTSLTSASSSAESSRWAPPGYHFVPGPALPDSLRETREEGRFRITITRLVHDDFERELLWRAEGLVPDSERIREAIDTAKGWSARGGRVVDTLPGERWWWSEVDGVLLPYAATAAAATYYTARVRTLSAEPNPFEDVWFGFPHRASFSYEAEVVPVSEGEGPSREEEVRIRLRWRFVCGSRCGVNFTHTRTVRFDGDGRVLDVTGDGPTPFAIS